MSDARTATRSCRGCGRALANQISAADHDPRSPLRAPIPVTLQLDGEQLDGGAPRDGRSPGRSRSTAPATSSGSTPAAIVRTEPRDWITNFEPNYLPHVEFYDEDFPWRYTPAAPDSARGRLRPWIALVVLAEDEFAEGTTSRAGRCPYIDVRQTPSVLPPADELWAWAHVHVNRDLGRRRGRVRLGRHGRGRARLPRCCAENPRPRLLAARVPAPARANTAYHAFLVPTFETGRLAGLGLGPGRRAVRDRTRPGTVPSRPEPASLSRLLPLVLPHRDAVGDFEYLVRLLQPQPVDTRVGARDMDVQSTPARTCRRSTTRRSAASSARRRAAGCPLGPRRSRPGRGRRSYEHWDEPYPHPFQRRWPRWSTWPTTTPRSRGTRDVNPRTTTRTRW